MPQGRSRGARAIVPPALLGSVEDAIDVFAGVDEEAEAHRRTGHALDRERGVGGEVGARVQRQHQAVAQGEHGRRAARGVAAFTHRGGQR